MSPLQNIHSPINGNIFNFKTNSEIQEYKVHEEKNKLWQHIKKTSLVLRNVFIKQETGVTELTTDRTQ